MRTTWGQPRTRRPAAGAEAVVAAVGLRADDGSPGPRAPLYPEDVTDLDDVLTRMEQLLAEVEELDEPAQARVFELLDGIDAVHRMALERLPAVLGEDGVAGLRGADPALAWLLDAYSVGVDERATAEQALEQVRPFVQSHGGAIEVLGVRGGIVRVRLSGACAGCTASAITLQQGVERALREGLPGFVALEAEEDQAPAHPPPGATLLQIENRLD